MTSFTLFDTAIGRFGMAWNDCGITAIQLPEASDGRTRARLLRHKPGAIEAAPPPPVAEAIERMASLLRGERSDLGPIVLDMTGVPPFNRRVYEFARTVSPGATLTYGDIAWHLGEPGAARAVGQALGQNPFAIVVPCHRVLAAGGRTGGFSAYGGPVTKERLLAIEGVPGFGLPTLFDFADAKGATARG